MKIKFKAFVPIILSICILFTAVLPGLDFAFGSLNVKAESVGYEKFTELNRRSTSGGTTHTTVVDENGEKVLKFKRNYSSVNAGSGVGIQLKTDDDQFYKLNTSTAYRVKFDYRVDDYSEADDAGVKDLSIMVGVSKENEGYFPNVRSVTAKDLDAVAAAHAANTTATQGRYAAVGARIKKDETDSNWHSVTAEFTTHDSLKRGSDTYDILTLSVYSDKTNAGDIAVSFKNVSVEPLLSYTKFTKLNRRSTSGGTTYTTVVDENGEKVLKFKRNYSSVNAGSGVGIQLKTDDDQFYKLNTSTAYRVKFDYRVDDYSEADDAGVKDLSIMVGVSKENEGYFPNVRSVTAKDLDAVAAAHAANTTATQGRYAAVGARIKKDETDSNWHSVTAEFTTHDSLKRGSDTYDILTLSVYSDKTNAGDIAVSFKNVSVETISLPNAPTPTPPTHDPIYFYRAISSGISYDSAENSANDSILLSKDSTANSMAFQLKKDADTYYKIAPDTSYRVIFKYKVDDFAPTDNSKLIIAIGGSKDSEIGFWEVRNVTAANRDQMGVGIAHGIKYPGVAIKTTTDDWQTAEINFKTNTSITNIIDDSIVYDNLSFIVLSGNYKTTVRLKDFTVEENPADNGKRTIEFITNSDTEIDPLTFNVSNLGNVVLPTPSKPGFSFKGWYSDSACTKLFNASELEMDSFGKLYAYAGWIGIEQYITDFENTGYYYNDNTRNGCAYYRYDFITDPDDSGNKVMKYEYRYSDTPNNTYGDASGQDGLTHARIVLYNKDKVATGAPRKDSYIKVATGDVFQIKLRYKVLEIAPMDYDKDNRIYDAPFIQFSVHTSEYTNSSYLAAAHTDRVIGISRTGDWITASFVTTIEELNENATNGIIGDALCLAINGCGEMLVDDIEINKISGGGVAFSTDGGTLVGPFKGEINQQFDLPTANEMKRTDSVFDGWYTDSDFKNKYEDTKVTIKEDTQILYAKFITCQVKEDFENYYPYHMQFWGDFEVIRLGQSNYDIGKIHRGDGAVWRKGEENYARQFTLFTQNTLPLTIGEEYTLTIWVKVIDSFLDGLSITIRHCPLFKQCYSDKKEFEAMGYKTSVQFENIADVDDLPVGEWKLVTHTFVAKTKYIAISSPAYAKIAYDDATITWTKAEGYEIEVDNSSSSGVKDDSDTAVEDEKIETGLNFKYNIIKKPIQVIDDQQIGQYDNDENAAIKTDEKTVVKKRKKLVKKIISDDDSFPLVIGIIIASVVGVAGLGAVVFIVVRKKRLKLLKK